MDTINGHHDDDDDNVKIVHKNDSSHNGQLIVIRQFYLLFCMAVKLWLQFSD